MELDDELLGVLTGAVLDLRELGEGGGLSVSDPRRRSSPEALWWRRLEYRQRVGPTRPCRWCETPLRRRDAAVCSAPACRSTEATAREQAFDADRRARRQAQRRAWWARTHGRGLRLCSWGCGAPASSRSDRCPACTAVARRLAARERQRRFRARAGGAR